MLALRNNNKLAGNNGKPLVNAEITSLQVVNTNGFQFKIVSTGPIRVYWGDGTYTDISTKLSYYTVTKTYSVIGTYNISIVNPENITALYFQNGSPWWGERINTNVSWFKQFYNLQTLFINNANFIGDLALVINNSSLINLTISNYTITTPLIFNVSNCVLFWNRCNYIYIANSYNSPLLKGAVSDINITINCSYIYIFYLNNISDCKGIIKSGYTNLTNLTFHNIQSSIHTNFINFDELEISNSLLDLYIAGTTNLGDLINFNFKNCNTFNILSYFNNINLINNVYFINAIKTTLRIFFVTANTINIDLTSFTRSSYELIYLNTIVIGNNKCYGDITYLAANSNQLGILNGDNTNKITGNVYKKSNRNALRLSYINCTVTASDFIEIASVSVQTQLILTSLPNFTGNISNTYFAANYNGYPLTISYASSYLIADITTFTFTSIFYYNTYNSIYFNNNPGFYGNLGNLTLWSNKSIIYLQNCAYTNIPGFINNLFTQRNTCLKATGGVTTINIAGNVDNASLTGTYQRGSLGTFTGNQNDLTEAQIDNLAAGLDYTGSGSSTAWTHKEKIWFLVNCKNSSTDSSSRYRVNITY